MSGPPSAEFSPQAASLAAVRSFVRDSCPGLDDLDLLRVIIVVNELATNAVEHAQSAYSVKLITLGDSAVRIEVEDAEDALPRLAEEPSTENGRGLRIVEGIARAWGSEPREAAGKVVWAELDTPSLERR